MLSDNFTGYILAGGKSSRMGRDKAFLEIGDKTFVENAFDALKPNCSQVKIVLNESQTHFIEKLPENTKYIFDRFENRGAPGGIHDSLKDCETEFAIILAVDLPFVNESAIKKLCEITFGSDEFSAIVPLQNDGGLQPLCAVYRVKKCLLTLEKLLEENDSVSVKNFLDFLFPKYTEANCFRKDENLLFNVNYPVDFEKINHSALKRKPELPK